MSLIINEKNLYEILSEFHKITGLKVSFMIDCETPVMGVPGKNCPLCAYKQNESTEFYLKCKECDRKAMEACKNSSDFYLYECHYHLLEGIQPVIMNGEQVGYFMIGQMLADKQKFTELEKPDKKELELLEKLKTPSMELIRSSAKILSWLAQYAFYNKDISYMHKENFDMITSYICRNLDKDLTVGHLSEKFFCSRSTLFALFKNECDSGVMEYIQNLRLEKAKDLLSFFSVKDTASKVGIADSNYFSRIFKKKYGLSPRDYIKHNAGGNKDMV